MVMNNYNFYDHSWIFVAICVLIYMKSALNSRKTTNIKE